MVSFIDRVDCAVDGGLYALVHAGIRVKRGVIVIGEGCSRALYEIYSLEGFEKCSKAAISNLRLISLIPSMNGIFDKCIKTLEAQKDLCYATLVFDSTPNFFVKNPDTGVYEFRLPISKERQEDGTYQDRYDRIKILYGIGNFFETGNFLQKYKIYNFPLLSRLATQAGGFRIFTLNGKNITFGDIPVLNCWFDKPKDFFVFFAAIDTLWKCTNKSKDEFRTFENIAKLIGGVGKLILIAGGGYLSRNKYVCTLAWCSAITDNASFFGTLARRNRERENRLKTPTP